MTKFGFFVVQVCIVAILILVGVKWIPASGDMSEAELWLVTSRKPNLMQPLQKVSDVYFDQGRVRVVTLNISYKELPEELKEILESVKLNDIKIYRPTLSEKVSADSDIIELLKDVSESNYREWMEHIVSHENRTSKDLNKKENSGNKQTMDWLSEKFTDLGYVTGSHCYKSHKYDDECNIVAEKKGVMFPSEMVIVMGHLDDVGRSQAGADDNGSGAVALLEMARVIADYNSDRTIRFVAMNGEELGLNGSEAYVKHLQSQGTLSHVSFGINMDMIAYDESGEVDIETDKEFEQEAKWYSDQARLYTTLVPTISMPAWGSDHVPFLNKGIPTILTIEDWDNHNPCYHQTCDKINITSLKYAVEIIKLNLAVLVQKAGIQF